MAWSSEALSAGTGAQAVGQPGHEIDCDREGALDVAAYWANSAAGQYTIVKI